MMRRLLSAALLLAMLCIPTRMQAQDWWQMHVRYDGSEWAFPYSVGQFSYFDFDDSQSELRGHVAGDETRTVPFAVSDAGLSSSYGAQLDSITFSDELTDWGKNKYKVFAIYITTTDGQAVASKEEYVPCYVSVDGMGEYPDLSISARIRGRGNSTWKWYDKKPYRLKFDTSSKVLGIKKNKDWVLLANYRDVSKMMNTFCFIAADWMGLPFTTPVRYAEVFLNGEYIGLYQIAEQVEVGGHRVDISEDGGVLLTLDQDDGPDLSPGTGDNFWSKIYNMPVAIKYPKDPSTALVDSIRSEFAILESAIKASNYDLCDSLMNLPSYIAMLQLQEYVYNVELSAPRSVFIFRDKDGKWTLGPAWDWDAGFDFSWSDMYTGHTYFTSYKETILGTDPYNRNGDYKCPHFFTDLFASGRFMQQYKERWAEISDSLYLRNWAETQKYVDGLYELQTAVGSNGVRKYTSPQTRENERWPISGFNSETEVNKLKTWLSNRLDYMNTVVAAYPDSTSNFDDSQYTVVGTLTKAYDLTFRNGYSQDVQVEVGKDELAGLLGTTSSTLSSSTLKLVPLNADGSEGTNTAAGTYGAWFDSDGNTVSYSGDSHVFIESNDLFTWSCGCHPYNCASGDVHTVTMQYRYGASDGTVKAVNVAVTFTMTGGGGGWWDW